MVLGFGRKHVMPVSTANENITLYSKISRLPLIGGFRRRRLMKRGIVPATAVAPVAPVNSIAPVSSVVAPSVVGTNAWGPGVSITGEPIRPMLLNQDFSTFSSVGYNNVVPVNSYRSW